ncbi:pimeloyl-ACP methyl ester carboxylesterase [Pseudomonas sp. PvP046]
MSAVQLADGQLNYLLEGPAGAPVLVLSNSLGTDLHMWDNQVPAFSRHFQVLRYDTRGHGKSLVTEGSYSIEQNGRDVLALLDALDIDKAFFCGLSMGGADRPMAGNQCAAAPAQGRAVQYGRQNR